MFTTGWFAVVLIAKFPFVLGLHLFFDKGLSDGKEGKSIDKK